MIAVGTILCLEYFQLHYAWFPPQFIHNRAVIVLKTKDVNLYIGVRMGGGLDLVGLDKASNRKEWWVR